jgi:hypothetical protein
MLREALLALSCLSLSVSVPAMAALPNLVTNGDFSQLQTNASQQFGSGYSGATNELTGWATSGYNFVYLPGTADTSGASGVSGNVKLWGPGDGSANGLTSGAPTAGGTFNGNYVAADGAYQVSAITQTVSGLIPGYAAAVSFVWAGAQQSGFTGPTTDNWTVSLAPAGQSNNQVTPTVSLLNHGFSGWMSETFTFIPTSATEVLSFLATGTPSGQPPFALLASVSVTNVPEPATWGLMLTGIAGLICVVRHNRSSRMTGRLAA